jgi:hypothetical protein
VIGGDRTVTGLSVAAVGGRIAFTATDPVSPAEIFVCDGDGTSERQLTDLNGPWKAEVRLSRPERFTFTRAGFDIDGWVMMPPTADAARRSPALMWIYGGPHREFGQYYSHEFQVQAGAGYALVYTNPRGSQGYGEVFSRAVIGDWGGGDFADVMLGLDEALRRQPSIDPERVGIIGISYGGFMTSWALAHTDRFKAACSEGAVNNVQTQFATSDIGHIWNVGESASLGGPAVVPGALARDPCPEHPHAAPDHSRRERPSLPDRAGRAALRGAEEAPSRRDVRPLSRRESHLLRDGQAAPPARAAAADPGLVRPAPDAWRLTPNPGWT